MSQELMDYVTARHEAVLSVLGLLTAEHRLSDSDASVLAVTDAEREADAAAARLAGAVDALPLSVGRTPVGWGEPAVAGAVRAARIRFVEAGLRVLSAENADESADADSEAEYADEQFCLAARNLRADAEARRSARAEASGRLL